MSSTYEVGKPGVVFEGLYGSHGAVSSALPEAVLSEASEFTTLRVRAHAPGLAAAVPQLVERVTNAVPAAVPLRWTKTACR
jgi:hexokinase